MGVYMKPYKSLFEQRKGLCLECGEFNEAEGKCPKSGCIKKQGDKWRIISNKTGKLWPQKYDTKESAEKALKAYHANH